MYILILEATRVSKLDEASRVSFESRGFAEARIMLDVLVAVSVTTIITAILTSPLILSCLRLSAPKACQANTPSPILVEKTYRIRGIPDKCAMSSAESLLGSILEKQEINSYINACSLAYDPLEKSTKVTTFFKFPKSGFPTQTS